MKRRRLGWFGWGVAISGCLAALMMSGVRPARSGTGMAGSLHDFNAKPGVTPQGSCSGCHLAHTSPDPLLRWSRPLSQERSYFTQTSNPNYVPDTTLLCYDCHEGFVADDDPTSSLWTLNHEPQDIALNGALVGYYENSCGQKPAAGNLPPAGAPTGGHYWKSEPGLTPNYAKGDKIACSLCHDPHNVQTGTNDAFFRASTWDGDSMEPLNAYGTDLRKSKNARLPEGLDTRVTGRQMCATCHGYADEGVQKTFFNVQVAKPPSGVIEHDRNDNPATGVACTDCHWHNMIAGCNECHGYPPMLTETEGGGTFNPNDTTKPLRRYVENYTGGAGAHRRHRDALGLSIFKCEICHGPNPGRPGTAWHNQGCNVPVAANVDIRGLTAYWGAGSSYNGTTGGGDATYAFAAKGGPDGTDGGRCADLTCHGKPPDTAGALNWSDKMIDDTPGNFPAGDWYGPDAATKLDASRICKWCHDATPARIGTGPTAPWAPNVLGTDDGATGVWTTGTWGAEVSGHGKAAGTYDDNALNDGSGKGAANKTCTVCHDARYTTNALPAVNTAVKTHFDNAYETSATEKRVRGTINGLAVGSTDAACATCHQNGSAVDGTEVASHENTAVNGYLPIESQFSRTCRQCHDVHGSNWNGSSRNLRMVGKWLDSTTAGTRGTVDAGEVAVVDSSDSSATPPTNITDADLRVTFTANSGAGSYDAGNNEGFNPPRSVCVVCHVSLVNLHSQVGDSVARNSGHLPVGSDCMQCHEHGKSFKPSGCFSCHGTSLVETPPGDEGVDWFRRQFWPDGNPALNATAPQYSYADNQPGAHLKHVTAIAWQLFGETPAQLVTDYTAGLNPTLTSFTKQVEICWFCHFDPGGNPGGVPHLTNDGAAPSGSGRVDVFQSTAARDYFGKFKTATGDYLAYGRTSYTRSTKATEAIPTGGDTTGGRYGNGTDYTNETCANLVCHNQAATPAAPAGWNAPPDWTAGINADCSNTTCHNTAGTYTNMHPVHVDNAQKNYACTECHANNYAPVRLGHGNGSVDMVFNVVAGITPAPIEAALGTGNGFYDKSDGIGNSDVHDAGDDAFAYKDTAAGYTKDCWNVYCHGGDNASWGGADRTPVWNNLPSDTTYCGSCHDGNGSDAVNPGGLDVVATGNHTDHLTAAYGPRFADPAGIGPGTSAASCLGTATTGCHSNFLLTTATHVNGTTEFANIVTTTAMVSALGLTAPAAAPDATSTDRCNRCHSTLSVTVNVAGPSTVTNAGTVLAKTNWSTGAYTLPCLMCHNPAATAATVYANGTGAVKAPDMLGDDVNYGAEIRGHNRAALAGNYPVSNNVAAAKDCTACHNAALAHINGSTDTTYAGKRMLGTINGLAATKATDACNNCHATGGSSPATKKNVNMHGNTNYAGRLEGLFPAASGTYAMECSYCHDPHGRTANGRTATSVNIYMVPSTITVPKAEPGPVATAPGVYFEALTGNYSFNDTQGTDDDDLCVVCHIANNMQYNNGGYHAAPGYDNDEEGADCTGCHTHNRDNDSPPITVDGFMTVACNTCHTFATLPGNGTPLPKRLSASHDIHTGRPSNEGVTPNKGFVCNACHFQSSHNNSGMKPGGTWPAGDIGPNVQVRFTSAASVPAQTAPSGPWNTIAAANNPVGRNLDSTSFNEGTNECSDLYCHGADLPFPAADAGSNTTPDWDLAATANCGTCHLFTAATPPGSLAHPKHVGTAALPADPQYSIGCKVCHYTTTTDGTSIVNMVPHVNHSADVAFSALADPRVDGTSTYGGDKTVGSGYGACTATYCHSNGTDRVAPFDTAGTAAPAVALAWNDATGSTCGSCHGAGAANSRPGYADGTPKANKHRIHNALATDVPPGNNYACQVCHWPTTQSGATIVSTTLHVNGSYEADDSGASCNGLFSFAYNPALPGTPGTCDNANCHGGNSGISWGLAGPVTCDVCHSYLNGARTNTDVNNFAWDGCTPSKIGNTAGGEYETVGHGAKGTPRVTCARCHDSAAPHDPTMAGANLYRLSAGFSCSSAAGCHVAGTIGPATGLDISTFVTHSNEAMGFAGYASKRTWPAWDPQCVNCHDPHGDASNKSMMQRELYDKAAFNLNAATPANPTEQTNLVFTDDTTGVGAGSYAEGAPNFSAICQECHEDASMISFHDGPSGGTTFGASHPNVGTTDCSACHRHDSGMAPTGCEACHDYDGPGPNVMGPGTNYAGVGTTKKPYDDGAWGANVNGHGANGTAPSTPSGLAPNAKCTDCHDISTPGSGAGRHLNGILNSVELKLNRSENTAHLRTDGAYSFIVSGSNAWDVQVGFDNACNLRCHPGSTKPRYHDNGTVSAGYDSHALDLDPGVTNLNIEPRAVRFGDKRTVADGESLPYPVDSALTTNADTAQEDFGPCISCHNPHGTPTPIVKRVTNGMLRDEDDGIMSTLCKTCHR